jgi:hypothetical protein
VQVNELLVWQIPPVSVRLGQVTDEFGSIYIYWAYVLEHELPPFSLKSHSCNSMVYQACGCDEANWK